MTLEEIAQIEGYSRERIRQILKVDPEAPRFSDLRQQRADERAETQRRLEEMVAADIVANPGSTYEEVAKRTGLSRADARRATRPDLRKLIVDQKETNAFRWSDEEILCALQRAGTFEFPLKSGTYDRLVQVGELRGPSVARICQRFGSWRRACESAGVEAAEAKREAYESHWTDADLLGFVCDYLEEPDCTGSFEGYATWAQRQSDAPSGQTVRNRLGGWPTAKTLVFEGIWRSRHGLPVKEA